MKWCAGAGRCNAAVDSYEAREVGGGEGSERASDDWDKEENVDDAKEFENGDDDVVGVKFDGDTNDNDDKRIGDEADEGPSAK